MEPTRPAKVSRYGQVAVGGEDQLAVEEPLEIRLGERAIAVTMRTPGEDFDLAAGFLLTEGILADAAAIESIRHWGSPNVVRVELADERSADTSRLQRNFYVSSSCGICGKASIDSVRLHARPIQSDLRITSRTILAMPAALRGAQPSFSATGALHAAGLFDPEGGMTVSREDVGRHNAVDKAIGSRVRAGQWPVGESALFVSGRAGFEIVQKAVVAAIPIVIAIGAPTSLAVELAAQMNLTLVGFLRDERFNIYSAEQRIDFES